MRKRRVSEMEEELPNFSDVVRREIMEAVNERTWWCHHCLEYIPTCTEILIRKENGRKVAIVKVYCEYCWSRVDMFYKYV